MKIDSDNHRKPSINNSRHGPDRKKIYGFVNHINNVEKKIKTPLGTLFICSIPGEDKKQPHRNYKSGEHIVSEDFVFVGQYQKKLFVIVGDGVTNKGKDGREAAKSCYAVTEAIWKSSAKISAVDLFKRWHEAIAESEFPEGSAAVTIITIEAWSNPKAPKIKAKAKFYSCGDVQGAMHTGASRFTDTPYFSTPLHRKVENNKLYKAATGLRYYKPDSSPTLYCHPGDILHNATDGVEDFSTAVKSVMQNEDIAFDEVPVRIQRELYLATLEKKSEHTLLTSKVKGKEKINRNLFQKYVYRDSTDNKASMSIKALDDLTSVIFQFKA